VEVVGVGVVGAEALEALLEPLLEDGRRSW
jgi:hypothetical protein